MRVPLPAATMMAEVFNRANPIHGRRGMQQGCWWTEETFNIQPEICVCSALKEGKSFAGMGVCLLLTRCQ
jgi:hypothetical protein